MAIDIVVFGAGKRSESLVLSRNVNIIAYVDNDPFKIGGTFKGKPVLDPREVLNLQYNYIVIASGYLIPITQQLRGYGIDLNNMIPLSTPAGVDRARELGILDNSLRVRMKRGVKEIVRTLQGIILPLLRVLPCFSNCIVYMAYKGKGYHGNLKYLYEYFLDHASNKYRHVWVFENLDAASLVPTKRGVRTVFVRRGSWMHTLYLCIADYLLISWTGSKLRGKTIVLNTWHALGAFKKFGMAGNTDKNRYDYLLCSHDSLKNIYAAALNVDVDRVKAIGIPRTDFLYNKKEHGEIRKSVCAELGLDPGKKTLLYAPTFRDNENFSPNFCISKVLDVLGGDWQVLLRWHRLMETRAPFDADPARVKDVSDMDEVNPLLVSTDLLVTDYSSICFDFALLERPMIFYTCDLLTYEELHGFYFKYDEFVPGPIAKNEAELYASLAGWRTIDVCAVSSFAQRYVRPFDGHACKNVMDLLNIAMASIRN